MGESSDESDSDFTADIESDIKNPAEVEKTVEYKISRKSKEKIDELWAEMNVVDNLSIRKTSIQKEKKLTKSHSRANKVLASIFGKTVAKSIVMRSLDKVTGTEVESTSIPKPQVQEKRTRSGKLKFAGREIKITEKNEESKKENEDDMSEGMQLKKKSKGLDSVLTSLETAKSISTVEKSSMDWDKYKEGEGIVDELSQATKDGAGYIHKQEFLDRVDVRQFEHERDQRMSKRAK